MGGTDQRFNLLVGRELQREAGQPPQIVAMVPLLEGTDGVDKMSKSKGNYIGITEPPKVIFRKVMGISDTLMWRYWELLTDKSMADIAAMKKEEPMQVKMRLARQIVADFHSAEAADQAQADFDREVREGAAPSDMETVVFAGDSLPKILVGTNLAESRTDAERKIKAGAVEIDGARYTDLKFVIPPGGAVFHVGKKWKRIVP
jgi:tyrosyl-tRNA synthetase